MNELTYYVLATTYNAAGENLWGWAATFEIERHRPRAETREWVLDNLRHLLAEGLVSVGTYAPDGPGRAGWDEWQGTPDEIVERVAAVYTLEPGDVEVPFWDCYIMDTPKGDALFEAERARRRRPGIFRSG
ncbi:hypothetical protein KK092_11945 [Curtobacterium flaccumfaciens pv. flaccumfaciens]|uniref:hypothetical protein n=1 Tax=Curtobacterium flaccumfaciens TaxID=2035 RepID=UPI001BDE53F8|nr:hypothetical protein [Curtobacterium flaccumfaciens]MBT1670094.1 hypothetical protein [Curtobacterium flaccumfaciens pv. flaccumfaciens]